MGFLDMSAFEVTGLPVSILLRGAVLLAVAFAIALVLRRARPAARHHLWGLAVAGLVALPVLVAGAPSWRIELPLATTVVEVVHRASGTERASANGPAAGRAPVETAETLRLEGSTEAVVPRTALPSRSTDVAAFGGREGGAAGTLRASWLQLALIAWAAGLFLLGGRLVVGFVRAARLVHRADPVTDRRWNLLVSRLSLRAGLVSGVRVVSSEEVDVPMVWGLFNSWLVLPRGIESWPEERRRVVVLHELAHLKRRDCLWQALGQLALAIHWINPLAWLALRRMRVEREKACDDEVLAAGIGGPAYAHHLVDIARGLTRRPQPAHAAVAMARPSELETRVLAILDGRRRRGGLGRAAWRGGLLALIALLVPVAMLAPAPPERADESRGADAGSDPAVQLTVDDGNDVEAPVSRRGAESVGDASERIAERNVAGTAEAKKDPDTHGEFASLLVDLERDTLEERVFQALERALGSEDPDVRRRVARTFGTIESPRGVAPLSTLLREDPDAAVRAEAAWGLGMIESEDGVGALEVGIEDSDPGVRKQAVWALGMIESPEGVEPLLRLLDAPEPNTRKRVAWSLGMIESAAAVEPLREAFATEEVAEVRGEIIWALGMIEDRTALETVADALEDSDPGVREQALWALGMIMD